MLFDLKSSKQDSIYGSTVCDKLNLTKSTQNYQNDATVNKIGSLSKSGMYPQETLSRSKKVVEINNLCIIGSWEDDKDQGIKLAPARHHGS